MRVDEEYLESVLDVVETIPRGSVMTYGDVAEVVGARLGRGGPRQVGAALREAGGAVPWWRVVNAQGSPPTHHLRRALELLRDEDCPLTADGSRVQLRAARARTDDAEASPQA